MLTLVLHAARSRGADDRMDDSQSSKLEPDLPIGTCPLCGSTIGEVRRAGLWDDRNRRTFGSWWFGRCPACDVDFRLKVERCVPGDWRLDAPEPDLLISALTAAEIETLTMKYDRHRLHQERWRSFLARRRTGDEVWRYGAEAGGETGIAIVRGGRPIARFLIRIQAASEL